MIHLNLSGAAGGTVYLDVQEVEASRREGGEVFVLSGTLGDGLHEGQVLVEIGSQVEVLFIDEWLDGGGIDPLLQHLGREAVKDALAQAAVGLRFCLRKGTEPAGQVTGYGTDGRWFSLRPREYEAQLELPLLVAETEPAWERQAA